MQEFRDLYCCLNLCKTKDLPSAKSAGMEVVVNALPQNIYEASGRPHQKRFRSQLTLSSLPCSYPGSRVITETRRPELFLGLDRPWPTSATRLRFGYLAKSSCQIRATPPLASYFDPVRDQASVLFLPAECSQREACRLQTLSSTTRASPTCCVLRARHVDTSIRRPRPRFEHLWAVVDPVGINYRQPLDCTCLDSPSVSASRPQRARMTLLPLHSVF